MRISERARSVKPSATLAMAARAKAMRAEGVDVLSFSAGEPDFDTPANIKDAAKASLDRGETKYTPVPGIPPLRKAVAEWTNARYPVDMAPDNVVVGCGAKQVVFNAAAALLEPGDEAIIFAPYWVSYPDMFGFFGASTTVLGTSPDNGFEPNPDDLAAAISDKTRLVLLNSPNNPCGASFSQKTLDSLGQLLEKHPNVAVVTDDIYSELVFDGKFSSILHANPDLVERTLIVQGVSKTYSMTGWRIGYGIGPKELVGAMARVQGASTSGACSIAQAAALEALEGPQDEVLRMRDAFKARRDRMIVGLRGIDGVKVANPGGAFYAFPDLSAFYGNRVKNSFEMSEYLLDTQHMATVPGGAFGIDACIRMSFACGEGTIDEGLARLREGLSGLR